MRVSTRGRYGLRAMLELADRNGQSPITLEELAGNLGVSGKYLYSLLNTLKEAGLVVTSRGPGGGFSLSRAPKEINARDVMLAVEGPLCLVECVEDKHTCNKSSECPARATWQNLAKVLETAMREITLESMAKPTKRRITSR